MKYNRKLVGVRLCLGVFLALPVFIVACSSSSGGGVPSAIGGSENGDAGNSGGTAGAGTGGSDAGVPQCPTTLPDVDTECAEEGLLCEYGDRCCPFTARCEGQIWNIMVANCSPPACPEVLPAAGASCECGPDFCAYDCIDGQQATANCVDKTWVLHAEECTKE